jgi:murein L,D-transpeptidase YcbB/YkuD
VHLLKSITLILLTTLLAVVLEAVTLSSVNELDNIHNNLTTQTENYQNYDKEVTLSEIIYDEESIKELMSLLITNEEKTFKQISHKKFIEDVYQRNTYRPIWFNVQGIKKEALYELFNTIREDRTLEENGPIKKEYRRLKTKITNTPTRILKEELLLDLELSSLYNSYLNHHLYGSINWRSFQGKLRSLRRRHIAANWVTNNPKYDIANILLTHRLSYIVDLTTPTSFHYKELYRELVRLRKAQAVGGWKKIPNSSQLRFGKSGKVVKQLTLRLQSEGDYTCQHKGKTYTYDNCLKKAVKHFQKRHEIAQTGTINKSTRRKLNLSVNWKIKKVLLNLDRIQRLPKQAETRYIMVNIPDFRLYYKENGKNALTMRVVVGDKKHHTPIFSNKISYIVLNPYWRIPDSIVQKEMIPKMLKNPDYLAQRGYEVRKSQNVRRPALDTSKIDWARVMRTGQTKKYKFMQPPGEKNALGKIKFKFPNRFAVYLHDTPAKKYFKKSFRAFSHGCIRISKPRALLATFAKFERSVNYARAKRILRGKTKTQLNLAHKVPVHIVYLTARIKSDGLLHYLPDVYGYDTKQTRSIH